ncbi:MAG: helix-turn-helix transcriptional regulator [Roseburia sp.]|nr:helix-turn-helix transcriptional regulator [Roseburia sp.]
MTVQERINELLKSRGWTKYKLAKEIGVYPTTVYSWFDSRHVTPSSDSIGGVCAVFGLTYAQFYSKVDESQLNEEQFAVLELYSRIPTNKRKIVLDLMFILSE